MISSYKLVFDLRRRYPLFGSNRFSMCGLMFLVSMAAHGCATMHPRPNSTQDQFSIEPLVGAPAVTNASKLKPVSTLRSRNAKLPESDTSPGVHVGDASWYGPGFHGKLTASGEIFDENELTAAHKTLPLGSWVRVTNLGNGNTVDVAINDRGPFVDGRIIDLSKAAAKVLGIIEEGIARVRVELINETPPGNSAVGVTRR